MRLTKRSLALPLAVFGLLGGLLVAGPVGNANAAPAPGVPTMTLSPAGPYRDGATVTVVATGFSPFAPVAIAQCADRPILGPGDCGRSVAGALKLVTTDAHGVGRAILVVGYGPLNNPTPPAASCTAVKVCIIDAINIGEVSEELRLPLAMSGTLVKPKVTMSLNKPEITLGSQVKFKGQVKPNANGEHVLLQRKQKSGWTTMKQVTVKSTSYYSVRYTPTSRKDFNWRVRIDARSWHPAAVSPKVKLRVT